jgi:hypothetical protein
MIEQDPSSTRQLLDCASLRQPTARSCDFHTTDKHKQRMRKSASAIRLLVRNTRGVEIGRSGVGWEPGGAGRLVQTPRCGVAAPTRAGPEFATGTESDNANSEISSYLLFYSELLC